MPWKTLGWAGFIRVDGTAYSFLGDPSLDSGVQKAVQKSFKVGYSSIDCLFVFGWCPSGRSVHGTRNLESRVN